MMADLHYLRPWWLLAIFPLLALALILWRQPPKLHAWEEICDSNLLDHLLQRKRQSKRFVHMACFFVSIAFMIIGIAGPSWHQLPVPTYKQINPRVLILDLSDNMMADDLTPNRLSRARFKLHDLFMRKDVGQFGLVVFTGEPFVVSPLTDDGQTISSLLSTLTPDIMPVGGNNLDSALNEAHQLIKQAGYNQGQILVLTADTPSVEAIATAKKLAETGIVSSIMPMRADKNLNPLFQRFANSGDGALLEYATDSSDLEQWLKMHHSDQLARNTNDDIPLWRDEGRWFLIPALLLLLPMFQRGWLQRMAV